MALRTYVLEEHMQPTAPIYIHVAKGKRMRIDKIPLWEPYLQYTFVDENEKARTTRLKLNSDSIYQDEQIKAGILANERYTTAERNCRKFRNGVLLTDHPTVQKFLEEGCPHYVGFKGKSQEVKQATFRRYDKSMEIKSTNKAFKDSLAAANKISELDLKGAQDLLLKIYGFHYVVPDDLEEAQNALVEYMNGSDEAVEEILKEEITIDQEITILIGKLMNAKKVSFDAIEGQVAKWKNDKWIPLKSIGLDYSVEEKERIFSEFLSTPSGLTILADLKNEADKIGVKPEVKPDTKIKKE